jgi:Protein of unknown function (DUF3467)
MSTVNQPVAGQPMQINIEMPADLDAVYSNFALITHSPSELVVDFARILPNTPKAKVYARVIMTPMSAKLLLRALSENIENYEKQFGEIKTHDQGFLPHQQPIGFVKK